MNSDARISVLEKRLEELTQRMSLKGKPPSYYTVALTALDSLIATLRSKLPPEEQNSDDVFKDVALMSDTKLTQVINL